jgi:autotransporter-associated beta strand protein
MTLSGNNTFGGKLYVNSGITTLVGANTGMRDATVTPGAFLTLQNATTLPAAIKLNLLYDGQNYGKVTNSFANVVVQSLTLNAIQQPPGTYGATGSGCLYTNNNYFGGTGTLKVLQPAGGTMVYLR